MLLGPIVCIALSIVFSLTIFSGYALGAETAQEPSVASRLLEAGREAARLGDYGKADDSLQGALTACRAEADERCTWEALSSLASVSRVLGKLAEARGFAEEAATTAHRLRDRYAQGESYLILAEVLVEQGKAEEARSASERALAVGKELERGDLTTRALTVLGDLEFAAGKPKESCRAFDEALGGAMSVDLTPLRIRARMGLGRCLMEKGELGNADSVLRAAFSDALQIGDKLSVARLLQEIARLEAHRSDPALGEELLLEAIAKFRSLGARGYAERASADLAKLRAEASLPTEEERAEQAQEAKRQGLERLEAGDVEAAVLALKKSVSLSPYDPEPHVALAWVYRAQGQDGLADEESQYASALSEKNSPFDLTTGNPRYLDYFSRARQQIDRVYMVPNEVSGGGLEGSVRVAFTLDKSGRLEDASVETTSGSDVLDEAAITTLRLAEPFASFPKGVSQEKVTIVARFAYERDLLRSPFGARAEGLKQ